MKGKRCIPLIITAVVGFLACGPSGSIEISSTPEGADVYLGELLQEEQTNCVLTKLDDGEYTVRLDLDGYAGWMENVTIVDGGTATIDATLFEAENVAWTYQAGAWINGIPAIADDGTIYFTAEDKNLYALDPQGNLLWTYEVEGGLRSSPAIGVYGNIYIGDFNGWVYSVSPDGLLDWKFQPDTLDCQINSSAAIGDDGTIYVIFESLGSSADARLYALNADGSENWYKDSLGTFLTGFKSPTIAENGTIYLPAQGGIVAVSSDQSIKWITDLESTAQALEASICANGTIYAGVARTSSAASQLMALNPADGVANWQYTIGPSDIVAPVAVNVDGDIFVSTSHGYVYALGASGQFKWQYNQNFGNMRGSTPAIGADGLIYVGTGNAILTALNPDSSVAWEYDTGEDFIGSPAMARTGMIFVGAGSTLYAIATSSGGLADSPWPSARHDNHNTGNVSGP